MKVARKHDKSMRIMVGCGLEEFKKYYRRLALDKEWRGTFGFTEELGLSWEKILVENPDLLLVMRENHGIIGHVIWHETSTDEHREGDPRDQEDQELLRKLCGGRKEKMVELHEIWLRKKYRGKGYGKKLFEFFEDFIRSKHYDTIVYYADHPAALTICRARGWKEGFLEKENWHTFCLSF
jgi:GNAT superfamily N-acetyltransferase